MCCKNIRKEIHDLESSKVFVVSDSMIYEDEQEKLYKIIEKYPWAIYILMSGAMFVVINGCAWWGSWH